MQTYEPTRRSYLDEPFLLQQSATVLGVLESEDGGARVVLDRTVLHPQGGGQPWDTGRIVAGEGAVFEVKEVRVAGEHVEHHGRFTRGRFAAGQQVEVKVDEERRRLNSRLHSAGHLLDVAMENLGHGLKPAKGYHFPDGPYVEYEGVLEAELRDEARRALEAELRRLVAEGSPVRFEREGNLRVVTVAGQKGCPCGGTHVRDILEIGSVSVTKIKAKAGMTRVSYIVA